MYERSHTIGYYDIQGLYTTLYDRDIRGFTVEDECADMYGPAHWVVRIGSPYKEITISQREAINILEHWQAMEQRDDAVTRWGRTCARRMRKFLVKAGHSMLLNPVCQWANTRANEQFALAQHLQ